MNKIPPRFSYLIVEDEPLYRETTRDFISDNAAPKALHVAGSVRDGLKMAETYKPEVLMVDIKLPDGTGIDLIEQLKEMLPNLKIMVATSFSRPAIIYRLMRLNVRCYLDKFEYSKQEIEMALIALLTGLEYHPRAWVTIANRLQENSSIFKMLTNREMELMDAIAEGMDNLALSEHFNISQSTAAKHRTRMMAKLDVSSSLELMHEARKMGFGFAD